MNRYIIIGVIVLAVLAVSALLFFPGVLSSKAGPVSINSGTVYDAQSAVVLRGTAPAESQVSVLFNGKLGSAMALQSGQWSIDLGILPEGSYVVTAVAAVSNDSNSATATRFTVSNAPSILSRVQGYFTAALLQGATQSGTGIFLDQQSPEVLQGKWKLVQ